MRTLVSLPHRVSYAMIILAPSYRRDRQSSYIVLNDTSPAHFLHHFITEYTCGSIGHRFQFPASSQWCYVPRRTGGVVPSVAGDLHRENLCRVMEEALGQSGLALGEIGAVAVTTGPGLALCLDAGLQFAKEVVWRAE